MCKNSTYYDNGYLLGDYCDFTGNKCTGECEMYEENEENEEIEEE